MREIEQFGFCSASSSFQGLMPFDSSLHLHFLAVWMHFILLLQHLKYVELPMQPQPKGTRGLGALLDSLIFTEGKASTEEMKPADTCTVSADLHRNPSQTLVF